MITENNALKIESVRADSLAPGDRFFSEVDGDAWLRTAKHDPSNRALCMRLKDYGIAYFGEAQMVWKVTVQ